MRRKLLEALTYPRLFVLDNIGHADCPHDNLFDASCDRCHDCDLARECHWMSCLNNFTNFANKPAHTINASLLYGINLVDMRNRGTLQHTKTCTCESCTWVRDAQQLTAEFAAIHPTYQHKSTH